MSTVDFSEGLPVYLIDEDIYDYRPSLLIATSDKFAALPWQERCRELFNLGDATTPPPDLIIQDELHLISGPLGTLAGLYETAIDLLCATEDAGRRSIASTATIRRADRQTQGAVRPDDACSSRRRVSTPRLVLRGRGAAGASAATGCTSALLAPARARRP